MKLSRDNSIYKRLEALAPFEKREAIQTEIYSRANYRIIGYRHITKINHIGWQPFIFEGIAKKIFDLLDKDKQMYFLSILLIAGGKDNQDNKGVFTIRKEIFADFGHIPYSDNMGKEIDKLNGSGCREYLNGVWWDSRKKAILEPDLKVGDSSFGGANTTEYYLELSTGMTKKEAQDFATRAIEELYQNSEKYQSELGDIDFIYSICDLEDETITNTNWADMLFIYDYIELYSKDGTIKEELLDEIHEELLNYYDIDPLLPKEGDIGQYSRSHIRNWIAKIRKEINEFSAPIH